MAHSKDIRETCSRRGVALCLLCCFVLANTGVGLAQSQGGKAASAARAPSGKTSTAEEPTVNRRTMRAAEDAYLAGAKRLERNNLTGAEREFKRAEALNPENASYAIAISLTRQHRLTELVEESGRARLAGKTAQAESLLAEARAIDPASPIVLEHGMQLRADAGQRQHLMSASSHVGGRTETAQPAQDSNPPTNRAQMLTAGEANPSDAWRIEVPTLAGAIRLRPTDAVKSFKMRGDSRDVISSVSAEYGIHVQFDPSVEKRNLRFDMENAHYEQAMAALKDMADVIVVPLDETSILVARDTAENRLRLERLLQETIYLPGSSAAQINEIANVIRNIFNVKQTVVQATLGNIVVRAPEAILGPMNRTLDDLIDDSGEVLLDFRMYEVQSTRTQNIGATVPTQGGIYNVDAAATAVVNANQSLVQQAIAQGLISSTASNIDIALALIGSGLVQSSLLSSTIGFFGKGLTQTGITASTNTSVTLGLNSSDTRALDDVKMQVGDRETGLFRAGSRYPITTSTYTTGLSTAASALSNASINGVSVASLLAQYAGGSSETIPQISYEDLGVTVKATPTILEGGRINMLLDMKIEALAGSSLDGIPELTSRQFTSDITVQDGDSALMVSNVNRSESAAVTGIPGLSELPGFQIPTNTSAQKDTSQLVLVVTPHVVKHRLHSFAGPRMLLPERASN